MPKEGIERPVVGKILARLYGRGNLATRAKVLRLVRRLEGGDFYSVTMRMIFRRHHAVDIGMYSHGGCFVPGMIDRETTIGRYCSVASGVRTMNRNHPLEQKSTHAFFFNPALGLVTRDVVPHAPLAVGNDVWIGHNAIIAPHVSLIGNGAVVGAGAVVNKDIPPYAVVVGNPARVVRYRFPPKVIEELLASRWWERSIEELKPVLDEFRGPYRSDAAAGITQSEGGGESTGF